MNRFQYSVFSIQYEWHAKATWILECSAALPRCKFLHEMPDLRKQDEAGAPWRAFWAKKRWRERFFMQSRLDPGSCRHKSRQSCKKIKKVFEQNIHSVHSLHCDSQLCIIKLIKSLTIFSKISQQLKKGLNWIDLSFCFANCEEAIQPLPFANYHLLAFDVDAQRKASLVFSYQGGKISLPEKICWPIWRKKYVDQFSKK